MTMVKNMTVTKGVIQCTNARLYVSLNLTLLFNIDKANIMMNFD